MQRWLATEMTKDGDGATQAGSEFFAQMFVIRTTAISILIQAKYSGLEVVSGAL